MSWHAHSCPAISSINASVVFLSAMHLLAFQVDPQATANCYIWLAKWFFWQLDVASHVCYSVTGWLWRQCNNAGYNGLEDLG